MFDLLREGANAFEFAAATGREGKLVFTGNSTPIDVAAQSDLKHIPSIGRLQLGPEFLPGDYVLQIVVTDNLGKPKQNIISQWIDFEVVK